MVNVRTEPFLTQKLLHPVTLAKSMQLSGRGCCCYRLGPRSLLVITLPRHLYAPALGPSRVLRSSRCDGKNQQQKYPASTSVGPITSSEVDEDLWEVLDICSNEELEAIYKILFGGSLLSPLVKSLVAEDEPPAVYLRGRAAVMRRIESRFRFLAADSQATLRGQRPSYRDTLLAVRDRMRVECPRGLATPDLESEIFLTLLKQQAEAMQGLVDNTEASEAKLKTKERKSPASALQQKWGELMHTLHLGAPEMGGSAVKVAGAWGVSSLQRSTLQKLAQQLLLQRAKYQTAVKVVCKGGVPLLQREAGLKAAQTGLTNAAARYGSVSGAFSLLGPIMWTWLAADLARQSIGTDFQRITKAIFALAQVRLLRTNGFINPL